MLSRTVKRLFAYNSGYKQPTSTGKYQKYWAKEDSIPLSSDIDVRNYNIAINHENWDIFFFCFHPQVVKKSPTSYEIKKNSIVLALSFVQKLKTVAEQLQWQNRKSITFKFMDLGKLLHVEPGKGNNSTISVVKRESELNASTKELTLTDDVEKKQVNLEFTNTSRRMDGGKTTEIELDKPIKISLSYQEYRLFYELIRNSLFELSGWKFSLELQRNSFIEKIKMGKVDQGLDNMIANRNRSPQGESPNDYLQK